MKIKTLKYTGLNIFKLLDIALRETKNFNFNSYFYYLSPLNENFNCKFLTTPLTFLPSMSFVLTRAVKICTRLNHNYREATFFNTIFRFLTTKEWPSAGSSSTPSLPSAFKVSFEYLVSGTSSKTLPSHSYS